MEGHGPTAEFDVRSLQPDAANASPTDAVERLRTPDDDAGVGLAEIESEALEVLLPEIEALEDVTSFDVLEHGDAQALVRFGTSMPLSLLPARDSGVPLEMPVEIREGSVA